MPFALLPPMPLVPRLVLGLLGTIVAGLLNLVFRHARPRAGQLAVAILLSPLVIVTATVLGVNSGQRTDYVFWGAVVGILSIRGSRPTTPIPSFARRAVAVMTVFAVMGPVVGLAFHCLRWWAGFVAIEDEWEIKLSLEDGMIASVAGCILAGIMIMAARGKRYDTRPTSPPAAAE